MSTHTIRKVEISAFGDASNVHVIDAKIGPPAKKEIQADVIYAGFSGSDYQMRLGSYPQQKAAPLTPGYCFVGRVSVQGAGATKFKVGETVAGMTMYDSEAQKINVAEKYLVRVPDNVDLQQATGAILDWQTAYGLVNRAVQVAEGKRVFIHCLSGAVGYALMTLCLARGCHVYGTASERNHDDLRRLGAIPFTYKNKDWITEMQRLGGVHYAFDPLGFESYDESWSILIRDEPSTLVGFGGNMNLINADSGAKPRSQPVAILKLLAKNGCMFTKRSTTFYYVDRDRATFLEDFEAVMAMLSEGRIEVPIKAVFDLENIREPHENWGKIPGMGSCVVRVDPKA
jgi:synaptic vesicle membrane protein VAT-1